MDINMNKDRLPSFDNMWALENIFSIDLDNPDNISKKIKTEILTPILKYNSHNFLSKLCEGDTYRLVCKPEGFNLYKNSNGTISGVYRDHGQIQGYTQWVKVGINFTDIVKYASNFTMNSYIANKLNEIENIAKNILEGQFIDRLAKIQNGINMYMEFKNNPEKQGFLDNCMKDLSEGIIALQYQLFLQEMRDINPIPNIFDDIFVNYFNSKNDFQKNEKKFKIIHYIINIIIFGYLILIEWNQKNLDMLFQFIDTCNWDMIIMLARGVLPIKDKHDKIIYRPETDFQNINNNKEDFKVLIENIIKERNSLDNMQFEIAGKANSWRRLLNDL
jgi:hypothetical protein